MVSVTVLKQSKGDERKLKGAKAHAEWARCLSHLQNALVALDVSLPVFLVFCL